MQHSMIFDRFDTAVVPFPLAEQAVLKRRPVVVMSSRAFNTANGATLVAMVTTAKALGQRYCAGRSGRSRAADTVHSALAFDDVAERSDSASVGAAGSFGSVGM